MIALSPSLLQALFERVATGIVIAQNDSIVTANPAFAALVGYEERAIPGTSFSMYLHPDDGDVTGDGDVRLLRKDGTAVWTRVRTVVVEGHDVRTVEDITEAKRATALRRVADELELRKQELTDFAAIASHDLREPLRKIDAFGERLATRYKDKLDADGQDYIARMRSASVRMQRLIDDLLSFASVGETDSFTSVALDGIATEVLGDLEARIEETSAKITIEKLPTIDAEPTQMRQLFQNLIGNALKFHRVGEIPVVTVSAKLLDPWQGAADGAREETVCQIVVEDNGIGFAARHAERIFTAFHRLHPKNVYEGSGMGLAICRKITDRHRGTIVAGASASGGAQFTVTLPVRRA
ncbi:MAG: sensor signal transduction histidine kinase [Myxococcaceae bacterium]|jgi:PAS domain S-box-containing protein|nr:sensor signal transduction histidine kinase [Myxococcaceae bacterium]